MSRDPRVEAAIAHWAGRFVSNGVPPFDFDQVTAGLENWEDWCAAWSARANLHEDEGRKALSEGRHVSAGEHLERAAVQYHFAKFLFVGDMDQMKRAHARAVECRGLALAHLDPPGERVAIPYQGGELFGILRKPRGVQKPPVLVMCMGLDSAKEEMGANEANYLCRGMATLAFDGPGQGEGEYDFPIRADYEVPVAAVCDWVDGRGDLDAGRIGLWGVSLGGYYAPRAAAFEDRIRACISLSGPFDFAASWDAFPAMSKEAFRVRSHVDTLDQAAEAAGALSLAGVAEKITCPLFVVTGEKDRLFPYADAERLAAEAAGPTELLIVEGAGHVANNRRYAYDSRTADWMAECLGAAP